MSYKAFRGSGVALVTPFTAKGEVDFNALGRLIDYCIDGGIQYLVALGTTGESVNLSKEEKVAILDFTVEQTMGRVPIVAGFGGNNTHALIQEIESFHFNGIDAVLSVSPYYNKPTQEGLYLHYKAIAEAVDIPQVLYNVPGRTIVDMQQATVERLADIENIIAIKDATGDVARGAKLIEAVKGRMSVLSGDDESALALMRHGAKGNISVTANVAPKIMSQIFG